MADMQEAIAQFKREAQATLRGDDAWRHPDLYPITGDDPEAAEKSVQELVVEDIQERERIGIERYGAGIYTSSTPDDPIEGGPIHQAYREALDLVIYLRWVIQRYEEGRDIGRRSSR
jgi:hypothetical protein